MDLCFVDLIWLMKGRSVGVGRVNSGLRKQVTGKYRIEKGIGVVYKKGVR